MNEEQRIEEQKKTKRLPHDHGHNHEVEHVIESLPSPEECARLAEVFKQVSDGSRLRIFWLLCHCEECVSNIAAAVEMSDPAVSHHLKLLRSSGLITSRREGKEIYYQAAKNRQTQLVHQACEQIFEITCPLE